MACQPNGIRLSSQKEQTADAHTMWMKFNCLVLKESRVKRLHLCGMLTKGQKVNQWWGDKGEEGGVYKEAWESGQG